jgi:hypothetical protein
VTDPQPSDKAALRGEPSYIWREGQNRRFSLIKEAAETRITGMILEDGCGVGEYLARLAVNSRLAIGLEIELERAKEARRKGPSTLGGVGEFLPFPQILSTWFSAMKYWNMCKMIKKRSMRSSEY